MYIYRKLAPAPPPPSPSENPRSAPALYDIILIIRHHCHTHYLTPDQYFTSLFSQDPLPSRSTGDYNTSLLQCFTASGTQEKRSALRKLNNEQTQVSIFLILLFKLLTQFPFVCFLSISILSLLPFLNSLSSPPPPSLFSLLINSLSS